MAEVGESLSDRELDVLRCLSEGKSNQEIGVILTISPNTVKVHVRNILTKLGAASRTEAMTLALKQGLVTLPGVTVSTPPEETRLPLGEPEPELPPPAEPTPQTELVPAGINKQRWLIIALVGLVALGLLAILLWPRPEIVTPTPTETLFVETPIPNSNWLLARPLPAPRSQAAIATVGLKLYLIGGQAPLVTGDVLIYDTQQRRWENGAAKLTAVAEAGAGVLAGEIYVVGGRQANGQATAVVEVYSPLNNAWRPAPSLPRPISGGTVISDGSYLYLVGGQSGNDILASVYRFDPAGQNWQPLPAIQQARALAVGGSGASQLYVAGGFDGQQPLASCERFDPAQGQWLACPPMNQARMAAGATVLLNKLYVIGGSPESLGEVYDMSAGSWGQLELPVTAWLAPAVASVETRIYALGGASREELLAENYVFTPLIYQFFIPAAAGGNQ